MNYFEDVELHQVMRSSNEYAVSKEAIITFAEEFDPMPFHIDEEFAKQTPFGKLFASSVHTVAIAIRMTRDVGGEDMAVVAGLGWQDVKLPHPVFADDRLHIEVEFIEKRLSQSKPGHGIVTSQIRVFNQDDTKVAQLNLSTLVLCRPVD